jgi:hypothetical protein
MKQNITRMLAMALAGSIVFFAACKKDAKSPESEIPQDVISRIEAQGFKTTGIQKVPEGYLVEGDIILTEDDINYNGNSPELIVANEEHYRTNKIVSAPRNITVSVNTTAAPFPAALAEALSRYNNENLQLTFTQVTGSADIDIVTYYQVSNVLGSSGFPRGGRPYGTIQMNSYWYNSSSNVNWVASIITHEMGHCIGYRHTDYMDRSYSCGGTAYNEGSAGVGAVWIPGTPTGPSANSWMLSCSDGRDRPFTSSDKVALSTVY